MRELDPDICEKELKKRWDLPYIWGRKQDDEWDKNSGFIYNIQEWEELLQKIDEVAIAKNIDKQEFRNYCCNRWYNFLSAMAIEKVFSQQEGVVPTQNQKNRLIDFYLQGIGFDLKTSVFPANFKAGLAYAQSNPVELVRWLYDNQSGGQRKHMENRLFLMVYAKNGQHWKLKAEISWLAELAKNYTHHFQMKNLIKLELQPGKSTFSDLIWAVK